MGELTSTGRGSSSPDLTKLHMPLRDEAFNTDLVGCGRRWATGVGEVVSQGFFFGKVIAILRAEQEKRGLWTFQSLVSISEGFFGLVFLRFEHREGSKR